MVDHECTCSHDVVEMIQPVLSLHSSCVYYRHIACLADCMTFSGHLMAVSRHGINRASLDLCSEQG